MISWNKIFKLISCISITILTSTYATAITTNYYKLTKISQNGICKNVNEGGQFITFINENVCYESDINGKNIAGGVLELNKESSDSQVQIFLGVSYWGNSAEFKFKPDKSILNVLTPDGCIYVYKRDSPPPGVKTCTLIRDSSPRNNSGEFYKHNIDVQLPTTNTASSVRKSNSNDNPQGSQNKSNRTERRKCLKTRYDDLRHCGGDGRCEHCGGDGLIDAFGLNNAKCSACDGTGKCPTCHGTGYID